jgi:hypothetical protein
MEEPVEGEREVETLNEAKRQGVAVVEVKEEEGEYWRGGEGRQRDSLVVRQSGVCVRE